MSFEIQFKVIRQRVNHGQVRILCPYCDHNSKTYDAFRKHLTRNHNNELGIIGVKKQAAKLHRLYKESRK